MTETGFTTNDVVLDGSPRCSAAPQENGKRQLTAPSLGYQVLTYCRMSSYQDVPLRSLPH
jgi:hypothetical protein